MKKRILILGLGSLLFGLVPLTAQRLTAEQILDRSENASSPAQAVTRIKSYHVKGTMSVPSANLTGEMEIYYKAPNKIHIRQRIPNALESTTAFDGKVGWEKNNLTGLREIKGAELEQLKASAQLNSTSQWRKQLRSPKYIGTEKVRNKETYVIEATTTYGTKQKLYIDTKTFLTLRVDSESITPQGRLNTTTYLDDYRKVDGIQYPFRITQNTSGMEFVILLVQVRHNVKVDDSLFRKPRQ